MMLLGFIGTTEVIIILIIALLVFGPQKLPEVGRQIGSLYQELNRMRGDVQKALDFDQYTRFDQPNHDTYSGEAHAPYTYETTQNDLHSAPPALLESNTPETVEPGMHTSQVYSRPEVDVTTPSAIAAPPGPRGTIASTSPFAGAARETFDSHSPLTEGTDEDA